jgi:hypothetical protein
MTNHPTSEELFAFRDGELGLEKRGLVEAHVLSCSACQSWLDAMSDAEGMLRQERPEPGDGYFDTLTESVMARVAPGSREAARAGAWSGRRRARSATGRRKPSAPEEARPRGRAAGPPRLPWPASSLRCPRRPPCSSWPCSYLNQDAGRFASGPTMGGARRDAAPESKEKPPASRPRSRRLPRATPVASEGRGGAGARGSERSRPAASRPEPDPLPERGGCHA